MIGQRLDAVRIQTLLPDPGQGLLLQRFIRCNTGGDHLLPALAGITAVGEQQDKPALCVPDLYGKQPIRVAGDVDQLDGAIPQQVIGPAHGPCVSFHSNAVRGMLFHQFLL